MKMLRILKELVLILTVSLLASDVLAIDEASTLTALRLAATITGGTMPTSDPLFAQMVAQVQAGNVKGAATIAAQSKYFANYLAKRMAFQMQSPALDETITGDNDSTAFLIAHFTGYAGVPPSISTIWSENQTYLVNIPISSVITPTHINQVAGRSGFTIFPDSIDYSTQLVQGGAQTAVDPATIGTTNMAIPIPLKHVGGFMTASTSPRPFAAASDNSVAEYGSLLGTNLRMIEAFWEIGTGLSIVDFEDTTFSSVMLTQAQAVPAFIPENNPNFFHGQGQAACIACHGGGLSALAHGYSAVGDVFDYDQNAGFVYSDPTTILTANRKSLGSNGDNRKATLACDYTKTPNLACNGLSSGVDPNQGWDLSSWKNDGTLAMLGWTGPITGQGLNQLGIALGQATIVYEFLTKRVISEVCPTGMFTQADVSNIAAAANPFAAPVPGTDDLRTIVALVASNATCQ